MYTTIVNTEEDFKYLMKELYENTTITCSNKSLLRYEYLDELGQEAYAMTLYKDGKLGFEGDVSEFEYFKNMDDILLRLPDFIEKCKELYPKEKLYTREEVYKAVTNICRDAIATEVLAILDN